MSLQARLESLVVRVAQEFNALNVKTGALNALNTLDKSSLVAAINELKSALQSTSLISDTQVGLSTTYSSSKIVAALDALKADILGGADSAFDTLLELQQAQQNDQSGIAALTASIERRVRFDAAQTLTAAEQAQARANIGAVASSEIGNPDTDFVAVFVAALV